MKLSKSARQTVLDKSGGHCWYCGANIASTRWQADHFHPIVRFNDRCLYPLLDAIENMVPACGPCNNYKHSMSIEVFRNNVARQREATLKASTGLRQLLRLGRVEFSSDPVVFWFERAGLQAPDMMAIMGVSDEAKSVEWHEERTEPGCFYADISGRMVTVRRLRDSRTNLAIITGADWNQIRFEFDGGHMKLLAAQWAIDTIARGWDGADGNAGDGVGANGNMREVEALPVPDRSTSKPDLSTNVIEKIE